MSQEILEQLLHDTQQGGVYQLPTSARMTLELAAEAAGIDFVECDLEESDDLQHALSVISEGLDFPEWFGGNLDALHDCLTDLSWRDSPASVILVTGCDELQAGDPDGFDTLINVFIAAAEFWRSEEVPFWVFVDLRADAAATLPTIV